MALEKYYEIFRMVESFISGGFTEKMEAFYRYVKDKRFGDNTFDKFYFEMQTDDKASRTQLH